MYPVKCSTCRRTELGYHAWQADAARRMREGQRQELCPGCLLWCWPDELPPFPPQPPPQYLDQGAGI